MQAAKKTPFISSEIAGLWNSYMSDSMAACILKYFKNNADDAKVRTILKYALSLSEQHIEKLKEILRQENIEIPEGFGNSDVDINAPRLYTNSYYLFYLSYMVGFGMDSYALVLRYVSRCDIRDYFTKCLTEAVDLYNKIADLQLSTGIFIKAPSVEVSKEVTFIEKKNFIKGLFVESRPLLAREVTNIFSGILIDIIWRALITGFGQVSKSKQQQNYFFRGKDIATQHFSGFSELFIKEDIPVPSISESFVTDSTISPFSDRLMMYHVLTLCSFALGVDGAAIASSMRADLVSTHLIYAAEITKYSTDGVNIMIDNGWMEQPPQVVNHENLVMV